MIVLYEYSIIPYTFLQHNTYPHIDIIDIQGVAVGSDQERPMGVDRGDRLPPGCSVDREN